MTENPHVHGSQTEDLYDEVIAAPEPQEIDDELSQKFGLLIEDAILRGRPYQSEKCGNCLYYLDTDKDRGIRMVVSVVGRNHRLTGLTPLAVSPFPGLTPLAVSRTPVNLPTQSTTPRSRSREHPRCPTRARHHEFRLVRA
jgi:hypothetical protein